MPLTFKNLAINLSSQYINSELSLVNRETACLTEGDAKDLVNFCKGFPRMHSLVTNSFCYERNKLLYKQITNSKTMALNFFLPLNEMMLDQRVINWLGFIIKKKILKIYCLVYDFSYLTGNCLNDHTRFDFLILAETADNMTLGIGICSQYTEEDAFYRPSEHQLMFQNYDQSMYKVVSDLIGYNKDQLELLRSHELKLLWRSHMLGIAGIGKDGMDDFILLHLFLKGNHFQYQAASLFIDCLPSSYKSSYVPITTETFIESARSYFAVGNEKLEGWLTFLKYRYTIYNDKSPTIW